MKKNLIIIGLVVITLSRYVLGQNVWTLRNPLPTIEDLNGIAFGNGAFVAVGTRGTIVSSSNGVIWTNRGSTTAQDLYSIIFADNRFIAGGSGGVVLTSSDGISWTTSSSGTQEDIISIAYGKNLFVAVSCSSMAWTSSILTSPDGVNWSRKSLPRFCQLSTITYGNNNFVIQYHKTNVDSILLSPDGEVWTSHTLKPFYRMNELAYGNGEFVALGQFTFHSSDGINWMIDSSVYLYNITYTGNKFISVGSQTASSLDGINWTYRSIGSVQDFNAVVWGDSQYVAVGKSGAIAASSDGVLWTVRSPGVVPNLYGVVGAIDQIVAVGDSGTTLASPDGIIWTSQGSAAAKRLQGVAWGNGAFCAVSDSGQVFTSSNAQNWVNIKTTNLPLYCTYIQNNGAIIIGGGIEIDSCLASIPSCISGFCIQDCTFNHVVSVGTLLTSQDKINWLAPLPNLSTIVRSICWSGNQYVGVGFYENIFRGIEYSNHSSGVVLTSPDGTTWTNTNCCADNYLCGVAFGNKLFIAIGQFGAIMTSLDGIAWTSQTSKTSENLQGVAYGNGAFVAVGTNGTIISSSNGVGWDLKKSGTTQSLTSVTFSHNLFIAVGNNGIIVTSPSAGGGISNGQYSKAAVQNSIYFSDNFVRYALASPSIVSLKLFDIRGRLVEKLVENRSGSGIHDVAIPRNISSGMFIVSLRTLDMKVDKTIIVDR